MNAWDHTVIRGFLDDFGAYAVFWMVTAAEIIRRNFLFIATESL